VLLKASRFGESNSLTRAPVDLALALFRTVVQLRLIPFGFTGTVVRPPSPALHLTVLRRGYGETRQADTRRVRLRLPSHLTALRRDFGETSLCLHALSSFQRTGARCASYRAARPHRPAIWPFLGEPFKVTIGLPICQPLFLGVLTEIRIG